MIFRFVSCSLITICVGGGLALGQVDPSSATLLRSSGKAPDKNSLDSSRYTVRPESKTPPKTDFISTQPKADSTKVQNKTTHPNKTENAKSPEVDGAQTAAQEPVAVEVEPQQQEVAEQMRDFFMGGSEESIHEFKALLHPRDLRQNLVEVGAAVGVFYQDASSNYWYRRNHTFGPLVSADATIWITPFLGFRADFATSLASEMRGDPAGTRRIPADHQWWAGGLYFRKSFGLDRKSPLLLIGVGFREYRLNVPANDPDRIRVRTSGPSITLGIQQPSSVTHLWEAGVQLLPRGDQQEGKTGVNIRSGSKQETYSLGMWVGSRIVMDRKHQFYWRLTHTLDKSLFDGQANVADPISGVQPTGVYVNTGTTMFKLGYTWAE
ncbi:MAG: hypothetical protein KDD43_07645 [Bdellovibrionales bacterium]|nr:hypothetical protein [Bdellovibrionales bacterium]